MKKRFLVLAAVALLLGAVVVPTALAQEGQNAWFDRMFEQHHAWVDDVEKSGQIDSDQAQTWREHFSYMRDFHSENGFRMMGGMMGGSSPCQTQPSK